MKSVRIPKYNVLDVVRFNQSNQDDGLFKDEGDIVDTITHISVGINAAGVTVRYYFRNVDDWCLEENIFGIYQEVSKCPA